ncbi:esterase family protein [bacterium]|nr:esterase family protein [bacterium]
MKGKIICKGSGDDYDKFIRSFKTLLNSSNHSDPKVRKNKKVLLITSAWRTSEFSESHIKKVFNEIGIPSIYDENGYDVNIQNLSSYNMFETFKKKCPELYKLYHEKQETIKKIKIFYRTKNKGLNETYWKQIRLLRKFYPKITLSEILSFNLDKKENLATPDEMEKGFFCSQVQNTLENIIAYDEKMVRTVNEIDEHFFDYSKVKENEVYKNKRKILIERILTANSIFIFDGNISVLMNRLRFFDLRDAFIEALNRGTNFFTVGAGAEILCDKMILYNEHLATKLNTEHLEFYDNGFEIIKNIQLLPETIQKMNLKNPDVLVNISNRFSTHTCLSLEKNAYLYIENKIDEEANSSEQKYVAFGETDYLYIFQKDGTLTKKRAGEELFPSWQHKNFQNLIIRHTSPLLVELLQRVDHLSEIRSEEIGKIIASFIAENQLPLKDKHVTTFLYYDPTGKIKSVYLESGLGANGEDNVFYQFKNTGIFYYPFEFQAESRLEYRFALDLGKGEQEKMILDPYNSHTCTAPFGPKSVMTTLDYKEPEFVKLPSQKEVGSLKTVVFKSKLMKDERQFKIYTPYGMEETALPILIFHDGYDYLNYSSMKNVLDNMISAECVEPVIAVFTKPQDRRFEYAINPVYARFIAYELIEEAKKHAKILDTRENVCTIGASFGGLLALYLLENHNEVFGKVVSQSGSFFMDVEGFEWYNQNFPEIHSFIKKFTTSSKNIDSKAIITCGRFESLIYVNRIMAEALYRKNIPYKYFENNDGHTWVGWRDLMPKIFLNFFGKGKANLWETETLLRKVAL